MRRTVLLAAAAALTIGRAAIWAATLAAVAMAAAAPAATATGWTTAGPPTGLFAVIAAPGSPETVYASSDQGGFWSSQDGGLAWTPAGGVAGVAIVAVDPVQAATIYAATFSTLWKSTDGALTWSVLSTAVDNVTIAPSAPRILYAVQLTGDATNPVAVARSTDGGATWSTVGLLPQSFQSAELAVAAADPNTVYAFGQAGLLVSTDGGASWTQTLPAVPGLPAGIAEGPGGAPLYLGVQLAPGTTGTPFYRSTDGGRTWVAGGAGLQGFLSNFTVGGSGALYATTFDSATFVSSIFASHDGGSTWQQASTFPGAIRLAAAAGTPDRLFLAGGGSVHVSTDQGATWTLPAPPPSGAQIAQVLAGPPAATGSVYASENSGDFSQQGESLLWETVDGGAAWHMLAPTGQLGPRLSLDALPGTLYAASPYPEFAPLVSSDDGASWGFLPAPPSVSIIGLAADPLLPGKLAALTCVLGGSELHPVLKDFSFWYSNTIGRGWRRLGNLPEVFQNGGNIFLRIPPGHPANAYVSFANNLYIATPGSLTPTALPLAGPVTDLLIVSSAKPTTPPTLLAAADRPRILWKSPDGGARWQPASFGLPRNVTPVALAADPAHPQTFYLATTQQLFVTHDAAATWQPISTDGLPGFYPLTALAVARTPTPVLLAGTAGAGVFALPIP